MLHALIGATMIELWADEVCKIITVRREKVNRDDPDPDRDLAL